METIKQNSNSPIKYIVLAVLFVLPIVAYLFFSSGVDNFLRLPKITENVSSLEGLKSINGENVQFKNKITVASFFGNQPDAMKGNAVNLNEKIYDRYHEFDDFQFLIFITEGSKAEARVLIEELDNYVDASKWTFVEVKPDRIQSIFKSFESNFQLDSNFSSNYVFIIDKDGTLRGRDDDEDYEDKMLYGYNSADIAEVADKLNDDVKIVLAEYRLALKKNSADR